MPTAVSKKNYAVLMGDLIESSRFASPRKLHQLFNQLIVSANRQFEDNITSPLTITLGDEFQGLAASLNKAFEISQYVRLNLLLEGVQSRLVFGTATIETPVNPESAWNMMGKGLAEARDKLSDKREPNCYRFSFPAQPQLELLLDGVGRSLTRIETDWTATQLGYVFAVLSKSDKTRSQIARSFNVSENSLYKALRSSHFSFYQQQITTIQTALKMEDEKQGRA